MDSVSVLGVPWVDLGPGHVRSFFESVSGEGLLWEGKGHDPLSELHHKIVHGVCGLANERGGFFVVGAEEVSPDRWELIGVANNIERMSAHDWIIDKINGGLVEAPPFGVKTWELDQDRLAAVIRVEPMPVPPCMTRGGVVWQRLVGKTVKVNDARILAGLIDQGQRARADAERRATTEVDRLLGGGATPFEIDTVALAIAAVHGGAPDYASRLFRPSMEKLLEKAARSLDRPFSAPGDLEFHPDRDSYAFVWRGMQETEGWAWILHALWNGAISVQFVTSTKSVGPPTIDDIVNQAWRAMIEPLAELVGAPQPEAVASHLALAVKSERLLVRVQAGPHSGMYRAASTKERHLQRWTAIMLPTHDELASVFRELARSAGANLYEP